MSKTEIVVWGKTITTGKDALKGSKNTWECLGENFVMTARDETGNTLKELGRLLGEYAQLGMKTLGTIHRFSPKLIEILAALGLIFIFIITSLVVLCIKCGITYWFFCSPGCTSLPRWQSRSPSNSAKGWGCCTGRTSPPQRRPSLPHSPQSLPLNPPLREGELEGP